MARPPLPGPPVPRRRPDAPEAPHYVPLQNAGLGYYSYSSPDRQYGTEQTVHTLESLARLWVMFTIGDGPSYPLGIGDMSFADGRHMDPHHAHTDGRCADIRPIRRDRRHLPITIFDAVYDREETERLVNLFRSNPNVQAILFNDTSIAGVRQWAGHDNHLHVHFRR